MKRNYLVQKTKIGKKIEHRMIRRHGGWWEEDQIVLKRRKGLRVFKI